MPLFLILLFFLPTSTLAQNPQVMYETLTTNGSNKKDTTWAMSLPKVATDGVYLYTWVMTGSDLYRQTVEVKRKRLNSTEPSQTIWTKTNHFSASGGLYIDKRGHLHIFHFPNYSTDIYWSATLKVDTATSPQAATVTFTTVNLPTAVSGVCNRCRLGFYYDESADTIHLTYDQTNTSVTPNIVQSYYTRKIGTGSWSSLAKILDYYYYPNGREQGFYYPTLQVFAGKIHIFYTGNIFDPADPNFRHFNGIYHAYKDLTGSTWTKQWLTGPYASDKTYIVGNDSYITPDNRLVVMGPYVEELGTSNQKLQLKAFVGSTGIDNWQERIFYNRNGSSCVTQTADGKYNLFFAGGGYFLNWGVSANGLDWTIHNLPTPQGYRQAGLDTNCVGDYVPAHRPQNPLTMIAGYNQAVGQNSLADGHSIVLALITPSG